MPNRPYYQDDRVTLHHGDCLDVLRSLPDASVDSVVTDPPYGLEFMGKEWDSFKATGSSSLMHSPKDEGREFTNASGHMWDNTKALPRFAAGAPFQQWCEAWATECLRVLKPGGHLLAFGGTRTWHRLACAVEDAGFEMRDSIAWLYGSGFPKSLDVSKAIDKAAGVEREVVGPRIRRGDARPYVTNVSADAVLGGGIVHQQTKGEHTAPATPDAERWQGWGTALKPAFEPVVVARKPLTGTVAANVLQHGTGALNIDGCRIGGDDCDGGHHLNCASSRQGEASANRRYTERGGTNFAPLPGVRGGSPAGRWPANVVLDESQAAVLDEQSGESRDGTAVKRNRSEDGRAPYEASSYMITDRSREDQTYGGQGGASRFFYVAKAPANERPRVNGTAHPTVKPLDLMRWLVRLVTPPGGTVLEPFAGSGTTVEACIVEGSRCIAIEKGEEYLPLITQRIYRQRNPVEAIRQTGDDLGLFELDGEGA